MHSDTVVKPEHHDLIITQLVRAPRAMLWKAWVNPDLLKEWWCPKPWTTEVRAFDLQPGGAFYTFMRGPDGGTSDNPACFLEIVPQSRIVHDVGRRRRHTLRCHRDAPGPSHQRSPRGIGLLRWMEHLHRSACGLRHDTAIQGW